jgi:hypothetical protein
VKCIEVPWRCNSLRHAGPCQAANLFEKYTRIRTALLGRSPDQVAFIVLTFDPKKWRNERACFYGRGRAWQTFMQHLRAHLSDGSHGRGKHRRKSGHTDTCGARIDFVHTTEVTRRGWPHLNVILLNAKLAAGLPLPPPKSQRKTHVQLWTPTVGWLKDAAVSAGFGHQLTAERAGSLERLANYAAKVTGETYTGPTAAELAGEATKRTQVPVYAPRRFRALGSSKGFLPPLPKSHEWSGWLTYKRKEKQT